MSRDWNDENWFLQNQSYYEEEKDQLSRSRILAHNETVNKGNCQVDLFSKKGLLFQFKVAQR